MLVTMNRKIFDSLADDTLGWACIEPTFAKIRGMDPKVKAEAYMRLTPGQRALFMYRMLYDHACRSSTEFYCWSGYLLAQPATWMGVKTGLRYFGDVAMRRLLEEMELTIASGIAPKGGGAPVRVLTYMDLDNDPKLFAAVNKLYRTFRETVPEMHRKIGAYIRRHAHEFVRFV